MKERTYNTMLLEAFPELKGPFDDYIAWQDGMDTGCFVTHEDLLLPLIREAGESKDEVFLRRAGDYIELLLQSGDEYAENLAIVGLLEGLWTEKGNEPIRAFLGPRGLAEFDLFGK